MCLRESDKMKRQFLHSFVSGQASSIVNTENSHPVDVAEIVALPRDLVILLERAVAGENIRHEATEFCQKIHDMIASRSQYLLHEAESRALERAQDRLQELESHLLLSSWESSTESALLLFREIHRFERMRENNRQNPLDGINELLVWGLACLHGKANSALLTPLLSLAAADVDELVELYKHAEQHLPKEVQAVFLLGVEKTTLGFSSLQQCGRAENESLQLLADGAGLLAQLKKWKDDTEAELSGAVPLVGERVQRMLGQLENSGHIKPKTLDIFLEKDLPTLVDFWLTYRPGLVLSSRHRHRLFHEVEETLGQIQALSEAPASVQHSLLNRLEELFSSLSQFRLDLSKLHQKPARWRADLILAVLAGGIPSFYLEATEHDLREQQQEELALALEAFRVEEDPDRLLALLESELL